MSKSGPLGPSALPVSPGGKRIVHRKQRPIFPTKQWRDYSEWSELRFAQTWLDEIIRALPSNYKGKMDELKSRFSQGSNIDWTKFYQDLANKINELPKCIAKERRKMALQHRQYFFNIQINNNLVLIDGLPKKIESEDMLSPTLSQTTSATALVTKDVGLDVNEKEQQRISVDIVDASKLSQEELTSLYKKVMKSAMNARID